MTTHKLDTLVELQDQYSNVYPLSPSGARGWVRARRELPKSDPEVFIEWDKAHWRYHGEKDGWTFEHHFGLVDDSIPSTTGTLMPTMDKILADANAQVDTERCPDCGEIHDDVHTAFIDTLMQAQEAALGADGYFVITITPRHDAQYTYFEPQVHHEYLSETAKHLIETQLIHIATQLFEDHMIERIDEIEDDHEPGR